MAKLLRLRRGTDTQHTTFTGAEGEVTVNTTNDSLHVHDGSTAGGTELAKADLSNAAGASIPGTLTVNQLVVDDDGSGSPTLRVSGDDNAPWGLVVNNNTYTSDVNTGWLLQQDNAGNILMHINGDGTYENFYLKSNDSAGPGGTETCLHVDTDRAVHLNYQGSTKFSTLSTGINVNGTVTCDGITCDGTALINSGSGILQLRDNNGTGTGDSVNYVEGQRSNGTVNWRVGDLDSTSDLYLTASADANVIFSTNGTNRAVVNSTGIWPWANNTYDLGTSSLQWRDGWFDGTVNCDAFSCPTAVTAGSYGSASAIPNFTVDSSGRLTAAGSSALNNASETVSGIVELATAAETTTGTATNRAVHPAGLKVELDKCLKTNISNLPTLP